VHKDAAPAVDEDPTALAADRDCNRYHTVGAVGLAVAAKRTP
jgi:hypothetical protein